MEHAWCNPRELVQCRCTKLKHRGGETRRRCNVHVLAHVLQPSHNFTQRCALACTRATGDKYRTLVLHNGSNSSRLLLG